MKLWLANIKEGEWDWYFKGVWRITLIFSLAAAGIFLLILIIIIASKGKV
ncbi:hypothetical protein GvMRE_I2g159 [endosymbiont GvMRE of Glomus versiforme]|nr:hypothetical protein GvMRE_I2g159 [endosymbiont GvMRE of Glomus versiforme]